MNIQDFKHQALIDLLANNSIDVWESLGADAVAGEGVEFRYNIQVLERQIKAAVVDEDEGELGKIMLKLFMDYQADVIEDRAQDLKAEHKQDQDELHGTPFDPLFGAMRDAGMVERDFH